MANINKKYPEFPNIESFEAGNKTVVPVAVTSHTNINKVNLLFDTYCGRSGDSLRRVGNLFKVNNVVFVEFTIDRCKYVMDLNNAHVEESKYFNEMIKSGK